MGGSRSNCRPTLIAGDKVRNRSYLSIMSIIGTRIEETGTLLRGEDGFMLRRDLGGRWMLDLHRVPVDHVEKRVRISGVVVAEGLIDVDGVAPDA